MQTQVQPYSEKVIETMVAVLCDKGATLEERETYREALRSLVRLGQAEQLLDMQLDFNRMTQGWQLPG